MDRINIYYDLIEFTQDGLTYHIPVPIFLRSIPKGIREKLYRLIKIVRDKNYVKVRDNEFFWDNYEDRYSFYKPDPCSWCVWDIEVPDNCEECVEKKIEKDKNEVKNQFIQKFIVTNNLNNFVKDFNVYYITADKNAYGYLGTCMFSETQGKYVIYWNHIFKTCLAKGR